MDWFRGSGIIYLLTLTLGSRLPTFLFYVPPPVVTEVGRTVLGLRPASAVDRTRTCGLVSNSHLLYHLSYHGKKSGRLGEAPSTLIDVSQGLKDTGLSL